MFSRRIKKLWMMRAILFIFGYLLVSFLIRVQHYGVQRDFTPQQSREYNRIFADSEKIRKSNLAGKETQFLLHENHLKLRKIVESAPYVDWSQYVAKWLGWRIWPINKENIITPLDTMGVGGYDEYFKFLEDYKIWKAKKDAKNAKNS